MAGKTTIDVIGEDKALDISRAIIKTHEYCLANLNVLNDRERGYMFNEYFPKVNKYLERPDDCVIPFMAVNCNAGEEVVERASKDTLTEMFKFCRDDGQPDVIKLSYIPKVISSVRVAKSIEAERRGYVWELKPVEGYIVDNLTGVIHLVQSINTVEIMEELAVNSDYYIFVDYIRDARAVYAVGEDGES